MIPFIIFGAKYLVAAVAGAAVAVIVADKEQRVRIGYIALIALPLGYTLARLAGLLYGHIQPFALEGFEPLIPHNIDNSFPSDHTLIAGISASLAFLSNRRAGLILWACTLLVGLSRMLAGLHYASDIIVAAVLAVVAVAISVVCVAHLQHAQKGSR
jgi:undecaprenyl-diphosphatase